MKLQQLDIKEKQVGLLHLTETVHALKGKFEDPSKAEKSLFTYGDDDTYLLATYDYDLAFVSALMNQCSKRLETIAEQEGKVVEKKETEKQHPAIKKALDEWFKDNKHNNKYVVNKYVINGAGLSRFYKGKQGQELSKNAGIDKLDKLDALWLLRVCQEIKGECSKNIKENSSNFIIPRIDFTSEGWRQREKKKLEKSKELSLIDFKEYEEKKEWVETFDFHSGWNFENKKNEQAELTEEDFDIESDEAIVAADYFNFLFTEHAIEKDKLFVV